MSFVQGDPANGMYFVECGTVTVLKKSSDGEEKIVR
jgi:CRP-like cAMP-binding protein